MSTNPPPLEPAKCPLRNPQPAAQDDPSVLVESEAMRRMQDLLKAKKVSISDTVVFEYNRHSFAAEIMPDGSLKSKPQPRSSRHLNSSPSIKRYSSPSQFASDMAVSIVAHDEKVTRPRGKVSINGWSNCFVNGKALATIRNEMLHERKNENSNISKDKVQDPVSMSIGDTSQKPEDVSKAMAVPAEHMTVCHKPSSHDLDNPTKHQQESSKDSAHPIVEPSRADEFPSREVNETNETPDLDLEGGHETGQQAPRDRDMHWESASQCGSNLGRAPTNADIPKHGIKPQKGKDKGGNLMLGRVLVDEKPSSDEHSIKNLFHENTRESTGSSVMLNLESSLREISGFEKLSNVNVTESTKRELERRERSAPLSRQTEKEYCSKSDIGLKNDGNLKEGAGVHIGDEVAAMPSRKRDDESTQRNFQVDGKLSLSTDHVQETKNRKEARRYYTMSMTNDQGGAVDRMKNKPKSYGDNDEIEKEIVASSEPDETKEGRPRDRVDAQLASSQFQTLKEVSDLQQEILGDSDSDEESLTPDERRPVSMLKKRSHSPSFPSSKKIKRMSPSGSHEIGEGATREGFHKTARKEGSDQETKMESTVGTEMGRTQLDPETMEAAAIAAQIEKEEASNRARRTTRLAAGKIKQVDYKASAVTQVPRSVSSGPGSEENERNTNDNDFPPDATRTTRRRSISNQFYSSQRSSRRVAKLRSNQEKEQSSNDETENHAARTSSAGNGSENRSDKGTIYSEDVQATKGQGSRLSCARPDGNDRRRGRADTSMKRARHAYQDEADHDSQGRAYSTRASTRENSVADAEITDLGDPSDIPSECEEVEDDESIGDRCNDYGFTAADLERFAGAVKASDSVDPNAVIACLVTQDAWKGDDMKKKEAEGFLREIISCIHSLSPASLSSTPREVSTGQVLAFLSTETWRLRTGGLVTGVPRKSKTVLKKAAREDQVRSTLERSRRKEHRDVEEMRGTLEKEMELRRRAELDTLYIEIQVSEVSRAFSREKARCCRVEQETEEYRDMEVDIRKKLEKAKVLVGQLQGENNESVGANGSKVFHQDETLRMASEPNGCFETGPIHTRAKNGVPDDDVEMMDKNITTTSQRLLEMDRLRVLIAAREAEAEEFQRTCEKERMCFVSTLELKNRLETEIYLYRSHGAVAYCAGNSSVVPPSNKLTKETVKKGDHRVVSTHGNRGFGYARQKCGAGKNANSVAPVASYKNAVSASRPKSGIGKPGEVPKVTKRKPVVKNGGSGSDKT